MLGSVSVIIPTYNRKFFLKRSIESVLKQDYSEALELIVVDDGSTDGTENLVRDYKSHIVFLRQENKGVSSARNLGIKNSSGDWLAFLDSDDSWHQEKIKDQIHALNLVENKGIKFCHTNEIWVRNGKRVNPMKKHTKSGGDLFEKSLAMCLVSPSSTLIHKSLFLECGLFDETLPVCEDYDLWLRIFTKYKALYLEKPLVNKYGGHLDQLSRSRWGMDRFRIKSLLKLLENATMSPLQRQLVLTMLEKKINIYCIGASKRAKVSEKCYYEKILSNYKQKAKIAWVIALRVRPKHLLHTLS